MTKTKFSSQVSDRKRCALFRTHTGGAYLNKMGWRSDMRSEAAGSDRHHGISDAQIFYAPPHPADGPGTLAAESSGFTWIKPKNVQHVLEIQGCCFDRDFNITIV